MNIESVNIINLDRRTDLKDKQRKTWMTLGYTDDQIIFHKAKDGLDYKSKTALAADAVKDGFDWFSRVYELPPDFWIGIGELACMWSISRLLRHIAGLGKDTAHIYALADRYSKIPRNALDTILSELPNFKLLQFRGRVTQPDEYHFSGQFRKTPRFIDANSEIECALKIGDGVLAMTPVGAEWMSGACNPFLPNEPYECALHNATLNDNEVEGVYSTYTQQDEQIGIDEYYLADNYNAHKWEGQYPYDSKLGFSDIADINQKTQTGEYGNKWGGGHNALSAEVKQVDV